MLQVHQIEQSIVRLSFHPCVISRIFSQGNRDRWPWVTKELFVPEHAGFEPGYRRSLSLQAHSFLTWPDDAPKNL